MCVCVCVCVIYDMLQYVEWVQSHISLLIHLLAMTDVVVKSVFAIIDSLGISVGVVIRGRCVTTGCHGLSLVG